MAKNVDPDDDFQLDEECVNCDGTGECQDCKGTGKVKGGRNCSTCDGTGDCYECEGSGTPN